jgi:hypothetical protein
MKVFDLTCIDGHRFEGWFSSAEQFAAQCEASHVRCPLCDSSDVQRAPSAPRLNLGSEQPSDIRVAAKANPAAERAAVASVIERLRRMVAETENVGPRFAEEARRIHYAEAEARPIRGTATDRERRELSDEGIETVTIALPPAVTETLQ